MSEKHIAMNSILFDVHDVPRDQFIVGGLAWQMCRANEANPDTFGLDPGSDVKGWWFIRHKLIQDLAALNKQELLLWDCWGLMNEDEPNEEDKVLLDKVAMLTQAGGDAFEGMQTLYEHGRGLCVAPPVICYSPVAEPQEVILG